MSDDSRRPKQPTLRERVQDVAGKLIERLNDPDAETARDERDALKEQRDHARIVEHHLSTSLAPPTVSDAYPKVWLRDGADLRDYVQSRSFVHEASPHGAIVFLAITRSSTYEVDVRWLDDVGQIRFDVALDLEPAPTPDQRALLSWAIQRINDQLGITLWRLEPTLALTIVAYTNHDGTLSSRVIEHALAQIRLCLSRDLAIFRTVLGS